MSRAVITPQFVNQPKPGKKNGSVVDGERKIWSVPPELLSHFKPNQPTTIEWYTKDFNNQKYHFVKDIIPPEGKQVVGTATPAASAPVQADLIVALSELTAAIKAHTEAISKNNPPF